MRIREIKSISAIIFILNAFFVIGQQPVELASEFQQSVSIKNKIPIQNRCVSASQILFSERSAVAFVPIGTSYNLYSNLLAGQNNLAYHPDIEALSYVHRQNDGTSGGSGGISFDYSTDGGVTWSINSILTPAYNSGVFDISLGCRYPSAAIYNPPGNTIPENAFILEQGGAIHIATGSWGATSKLSSRLDGDFLSEEYYSTDDLAEDYLSYGMHYYNDNSLWDMRSNTLFDLYTVSQHTFNDITNNFDQIDIQFAPDFVDLADDAIASSIHYQVNFDPAGTIGYAVILGALNSDIVKTTAPVILKTTDGGATWNYLPSIDWTAFDDFQQYLVPVIEDSTLHIPHFLQFDATVDAEGRLHIFADIASRYSGNYFDSIIYRYTNENALFHLSTSDGTDWITQLVELNNQAPGFIGFVEVSHKVQIGRTPDANKIFFCWASSDSLLFSENDSPDIIVKGFDIETGFYTPNINVTSGTDFEHQSFYPSLSPVVKNTDTGTYELPIVFTDPGSNELDDVQYYYMHGVLISESDFEPTIAPVALFETSIADDTVSFINATIYGSVYEWDFGDGTFSSLENPVHVYSSPGDYAVCLIATNPYGSNEYCAIVSISATCEPPTGITQISLTSTIAKYTWDAMDGATKYFFLYRPVGTSLWLKKKALTNFAKITGLMPATEYQYKMLTFCGSELSEFTEINTFTTPARLAEMDDAEISVYPNPASGLIYIEGLSLIEDLTTITLYDVTGRIVFYQAELNGGTTIALNVPESLNGTYLLEIKKSIDNFKSILILE